MIRIHFRTEMILNFQLWTVHLFIVCDDVVSVLWSAYVNMLMWKYLFHCAIWKIVNFVCVTHSSVLSCLPLLIIREAKKCYWRCMCYCVVLKREKSTTENSIKEIGCPIFFSISNRELSFIVYSIYINLYCWWNYLCFVKLFISLAINLKCAITKLLSLFTFLRIWHMFLLCFLIPKIDSLLEVCI